MKKLNIAFIWHFHQPNYQPDNKSDFLLPWVRLHASKDYLSMLRHINKFENLKLNFNFSPVLLNALQKYLKGIKDKHLEIFLKNEQELTSQDKIFILNNYFDLNYKNMVSKRLYFTELYNKRANAKELNTEMFSNQEYVDIMANFTLLWINQNLIHDYKILEELFSKEKNYTLFDREKIYEIQLDIIKKILEEYKTYQDQNRIEVSTSPYYHPIMPLLLNFKNKEIKNWDNLPKNSSFVEDAKEQIDLAIEKYIEIFNRNPKGMWLSEQCICPKTADLISKYGFSWSVLDEGILAKSLKREFIRDFEGNLENPFELNINYKTKNKTALNLIFGDSFFANLINFGYGAYDYKIAANDMYEKIKTIQSKLQSSPKEEHILTIALDGENCWEIYQNNGNDFLETLYSLICKDESLNTTLVNDFINKSKAEILPNLASGSWINRNFDLWIGEKIKNVAWLYLSNVTKDYEKYKKNNFNSIEKLKLAKKELLLAQGSDWYWWYGEPNESKNDNIFDYLFRMHLINVYKILDLEIPQYLNIPLINTLNKASRNPIGEINPSLICDVDDKLNEWEKAGLIFISNSPTSNTNNLIKNIYFGYDKKNIYFRFELNKNSFLLAKKEIKNQITIYFIDDKSLNYSPVRFISKNENSIYPIIKNHFSKEVRFTFNYSSISKISINKACPWGLWANIPVKKSDIFYKDVIEFKIAYDDLGVDDNNLSFFIAHCINETISKVYPQDVLINL